MTINITSANDMRFSTVPANNTDVYLSTDRGSIYVWNMASGVVTLAAQTGLQLTDIAVAPDGRLFGITADTLYRIDPATGDFAEVGPLQTLQGELYYGVSALSDANGFDISPTGIGRISSGDNHIVVFVDLATGHVSNLSGPLGYAASAGDLWYVNDTDYWKATSSSTIQEIHPATPVGLPDSGFLEGIWTDWFIGSSSVDGLIGAPDGSRLATPGDPVGFVGNQAYVLGQGQFAFGPGLATLSIDGNVTGATVSRGIDPPPPPPANSAPEVTPLYPQPTYPVGEPIVLGNLFSISDPDGQDDIQRVEIWIDSGEGGLAVDGIAIPEGLNVSVDLASSITFTPTRVGDPVVLRVDVLDSAGNSVSVQVPIAVELPGNFIEELSQLAVFAYDADPFDADDADTSDAEAHGWMPIEIPGYSPGVQGGQPDPALSYTSYAYAYYGVIDGIKTAAIAFRGTDPAMDTFSEFITQVARWDEYYAFHQPFVRSVLSWAAREGVDQVVVTGHSLGGIIAEEFAANDIGYNALARDAYVVTFGSPGCPGEAQTDRVLQFVHTGDPVANLNNFFINREGTTIEIQRPETGGLTFAEHDKQLYLDSINYLSENYGYFPDGAGTAVLDYWLGNGEYVYVASDVSATQLLLEDIITAEYKIIVLPVLDAIGFVVVGTRELFNSIKIDGFSPLDSLDFLGEKFVQAVVSILPGSVILNLDFDQNGEVDTTISLEGDFHGRLVTEQVGDDTMLHFQAILVGDMMAGTAGDDLIAGSREVDDIRGGAGADQIVAREGNDHVVGDGGNDTLYGGEGNDGIVGGEGNDYVDGGSGIDTAVFSAPLHQHILTANRDGSYRVSGSVDGLDVVSGVEQLQFSDQLIDLATFSGLNQGESVFRFYNRANGTHFYTADTAEAESVMATLPEYFFEGVAFDRNTVGGGNAIDVHRFYNVVTHAHFYSADPNEIAYVRANLPDYSYDGVAYQAHRTEAPGTTELYRFYNTATNTHFYTADAQEAQHVRVDLAGLYSYDGVAYYVDVA